MNTKTDNITTTSMLNTKQIGLLAGLLKAVGPYESEGREGEGEESIPLIPERKSKQYNELRALLKSPECKITYYEGSNVINDIQNRLKVIDGMIKRGELKKIETPAVEWGISGEEGLALLSNGENVLSTESIAILILKYEGVNSHDIREVGDMEVTYDQLIEYMEEISQKEGFKSLGEGIMNFNNILSEVTRKSNGADYLDKRRKSSELYRFFLLFRQFYQYGELKKLEQTPEMVDALYTDEMNEQNSWKLEAERADPEAPGFIRDYMNKKSFEMTYKPDFFQETMEYYTLMRELKAEDKKINEYSTELLEDSMQGLIEEETVEIMKEKMYEQFKKDFGAMAERASQLFHKLTAQFTEPKDKKDCIDAMLENCFDYIGRRNDFVNGF
jgi:hypothetical protein